MSAVPNTLPATANAPPRPNAPAPAPATATATATAIPAAAAAAAPVAPAAAVPAKAAVPKEPKFKLRDDLSKAVRDFFKKQFVPTGDWRYESKFKGPANTLYLNQKFEVGSTTVYSIDVQYDNTKEVPFSSTLTFDVPKGGVPALKLASKVPVAALKGAVEVEATSKGEYTVTVDGSVGAAKFTDKFESATGMETVITYTQDAATVGAYGRYKFSGPADYGLAARYAVKGGLFLSAFSSNLLQWSVGAAYPFVFQTIPVTAALQVDGERGTVTPKSTLFGVEARVCSAFSVRAKASLQRDFALCLIEKYANNTTVSFTIQRAAQGCCGIGYGAQITSE